MIYIEWSHVNSCYVTYAILIPSKGPFNNYVDKMRREGVKMSFFVHAEDIKTVHAVGGGGKKFVST